MSVVVLGSANTDLIVRVPRIPAPGETILGHDFATAAGGKGANQAIAAARAGGVPVSLIARLGDDDNGRRTLESLARGGVAVEHVRTDASAPSGVALILVDDEGENAIAVAPGANARLSEAHVDAAANLIAASDVLLMPLETPLATVSHAARIAHEADTRVILNPAPAAALPDDLLRVVSVITPNQSEIELLTGRSARDATAAEAAARVLLDRGVGAVVVTLGARGALYVSKDQIVQLPGHRVEAVDTTAAGDVFNGCLAAALAEGRPVAKALGFANAGRSARGHEAGRRAIDPSSLHRRGSARARGLASRPRRPRALTPR